MIPHDTEVEQACTLSPVENTNNASVDSSLAAAQFEAIIRAWKGETVEGVVPVSPVGEVDWDGSLALRQLDIKACNVSFDEYSWFCSPGESLGNTCTGCDLTMLCTLNCLTDHTYCYPCA